MDRNNCFISTIDPNGHIIARQYGLGLEIAQYCTAWNMDRDFDRTDPEVSRQLVGIDRRILHAPFNELFPCAIDPKARELAACRFRQAIGLTQYYHADKVVIHGGYNPRIYYPSWYVEQSIIFWKDFLKEIPETVVVCLENVFEESPQMLLDIVREVNESRIRLCLDIGHINAYSSIPIMEWLEACGTYVSHFHIHNNYGEEDTHNALMDGSIPVQDILRYADSICPDASYTLELMNSEKSVQWMEKQNILR